MWLSNGLNFKQIVAYFLLLLIVFFLALWLISNSFAHIILGVVVCYVVWIIYQLVCKGFYYTIKSLKIDGIDHRVRAKVHPLKLTDSYKEIVEDHEVVFIESKSFLLEKKNAPKEWPYLDIVRQLTSGLQISKVLLLGGAACSLGSSLAMNKQVQQIDVIEISEEMIDIANNYFLNTSIKKKINLIHGNGLEYQKYCSGVYDLVVVDMFNAARVEEGAVKSLFVEKIQKTSVNGYFIVNLGSTLKLQQAVKVWSDYFKICVYVSHKNFVISNIKIDNFNFKKFDRLLFETLPVNYD